MRKIIIQDFTFFGTRLFYLCVYKFQQYDLLKQIAILYIVVSNFNIMLLSTSTFGFAFRIVQEIFNFSAREICLYFRPLPPPIDLIVLREEFKV
jgi:hypothetical protein